MYLVQDLIDGRLDPEEAARVEQLIQDNAELGHAAAFYRWLNDQLGVLYAAGGDTGAQLPDGLRDLVRQLSEASIEAPEPDASAAMEPSPLDPDPAGAAAVDKPPGRRRPIKPN